MAVFLFKLVSIILMLCVQDLYTFNIKRNENSNVPAPVNVEIDFYSNYETKKFFDQLDRNRNPDLRFGQFIHGTFSDTTPPENIGADAADDGKRMFLLVLPSSNQNHTGDGDGSPLDSWSVVWYIASFGGLIIFFLIVSCSEWCCRRAVRNSQNCSRNVAVAPVATPVPDTPPPSYDQFAPPSYDSLNPAKDTEKSQYDVYVVPVHALNTIMEVPEVEDSPPSYLAAAQASDLVQFHPACTPDTPRMT